MKVIQIIGGGEKGGSLNHIITLTKGLIKKGYEPEIVCLMDDIVAEEARANHIPVTIFPMKNILDFRVIRNLRSYIEKRNPKVIHTHGFRANFIGRTAAKKMKDVPLVTTIHSSIYHDYAHPLKKFLYHRIEKFTRPYTDQFITVADSLKKELIRDGIGEDKIQVIYNGLSPTFPLDKEVEPFLRAELGIESDTPILMSIGRVEAVKNQLMLLKVFASLKANNISFHGVLVGDGPLLKELKETARQLKIEDDIHFLGFRKDIYELLMEADVFLLTSNMEGMPITLLEAMATRTPVVLTEVGGMPEIIKIAKNGYSVPINDIEQFTARIEGVIVQPALKEKLAENGYHALQQYFTYERFLDNTIELYQDLIEKV